MKLIVMYAVCAILRPSALMPALPADDAKGSLDKYLTALPTAASTYDASPQHYRFTCDYVSLDVSGTVTGRDRVSAEFTRGLPGQKVRWDNVTISHANSLNGPFAAGEPQTYMDGFTYSAASGTSMLSAAFFAGFPNEMRTKTLVWDTAMFEGFVGSNLSKLKLNEPYRFGAGDAALAGNGNFHNTQPELTWVGLSKRNGKLCALIQYEALFNKLNMVDGGMKIDGSSQYLGTIWVSLADKQIEYATLREDVLMSIALPNQPGKPLIVNTFRVGTFEHKR